MKLSLSTTLCCTFKSSSNLHFSFEVVVCGFHFWEVPGLFPLSMFLLFFLCFTTTGQPLFCLVSYKLMDHKMWKGISFCFGLGGKDYTYLCALAGALARDFPFLALGGDASSGSFIAPLLLMLAPTNAILYFAALGKRQMHRDDFWFVHAQSHIKYQFSFGGPQRRPIKHKVLAVIVTRDKKTRSGFLHFRMCLIPGENLAPILGRSPGAPQ